MIDHNEVSFVEALKALISRVERGELGLEDASIDHRIEPIYRNFVTQLPVNPYTDIYTIRVVLKGLKNQ